MHPTAQPAEEKKRNIAPSQKDGAKGALRTVQKQKVAGKPQSVGNSGGVGNSSRNKNGGNSETKAAETVAKPVGLCDGVSVSRVVQSRNVSLVVAPVDKVSTVQQCSNISPEIVHIGADTSVDRISKAKPSLNNDHRRSQARNCLLHNADHPSSVTTSIENVQDTGSREESIQHISSLL